MHETCDCARPDIRGRGDRRNASFDGSYRVGPVGGHFDGAHLLGPAITTSVKVPPMSMAICMPAQPRPGAVTFTTTEPPYCWSAAARVMYPSSRSASIAAASRLAGAPCPPPPGVPSLTTSPGLKCTSGALVGAIGASLTAIQPRPPGAPPATPSAG